MIRIALSLALLLTCLSVASALPQRAVLDFDGDNKTDYAVVRGDVSGALNWYLHGSTAGFRGEAWGITETDEVIPGDYDGDLKWDIAVWRPGAPAYFYIMQSSNNTLRAEAFGTAGDAPEITQDFDGDGKADPAVIRKVGGTLIWHILRSSLGAISVPFGQVDIDVPIRGDYDGDRKADIAVFRNPNGGTPPNTFYALRSSDGNLQAQQFGDWNSSFLTLADYDGDGKTDYAMWHVNGPSIGTWYWLQSSDGSYHELRFGVGVDYPVPGDYDGDGKADQAVWRRTGTPTFYVNGSMAGGFAFRFGLFSDRPLAFIL